MFVKDRDLVDLSWYTLLLLRAAKERANSRHVATLDISFSLDFKKHYTLCETAHYNEVALISPKPQRILLEQSIQTKVLCAWNVNNLETIFEKITKSKILLVPLNSRRIF